MQACLRRIAESCGDPDVPGCAQSNFEAVPGDLDEKVRDACFAYAAACGEVEPSQCEGFATVEDRDVVVDTYECLAASCGGDGCVLPSPEPTLAAEACWALGECGWECNVEVEVLGEAMGWLRQDVRDALWGCLELSCADGRVPCVTTWMDAAFPQ